jgi:heat shock protein HslJ
MFMFAAVACGRGGPVEDSPAAKAARTAEQLANATYAGIMIEPVTLTDGRWEGEPYIEGGASRPVVGLLDHFILTGDLDSDGADEVAALLWESSGGSGTRLYLAAMASRNGDVINLATALIGDRVQVQSGGIEDGLIRLNVIRAGPEDGACCPTEKAFVTWALTEGALDSVGEEMTGTLSLADLEGPEWVLIELGWNQPLPDDAGITLVFKDARVSGHGGCNSYFAGTVAAAPGELGFNGMGATRMACPDPVMDLERRYLKTLAGASRYSFLAGRLVLSCNIDEGTQNLVYAPRGDTSAGPEAL